MTDKKGQRFTFDADRDGAEVPTLTSLLYKKNVVKSGPSGRGAEAQAKITSLDPTLTLDMLPQAGAVASPAPAVVISAIASTRAAPASFGTPKGTAAEKRVIPAATPYVKTRPLAVLAPTEYPNEGSGASGIAYLFETAKISSTIVFELKADDTLASRSIVGTPSDRAGFWTGMEFSKKEFSDLWGRLEKYSFAEFSTLGIAGQGNVDRMAFRNAFQAKATEWLTLVRVRASAGGGEALLVIFSEASIQSHIPNFHTACMGKSQQGKVA